MKAKLIAFFVKKPLHVVAVVTAGVLIGGGLAIAYWTASGTGNDTAGVGTDSGVTVEQVGTVAGLVPGGTQPINFRVTNNSATTSVEISSVAIGFAATGFTTGCSAADFDVASSQPSKPSGGARITLAPGAAATFNSAAGAADTATVINGTGAAITMVNTASNQNACKNSTVPLTYTVN